MWQCYGIWGLKFTFVHLIIQLYSTVVDQMKLLLLCRISDKWPLFMGQISFGCLFGHHYIHRGVSSIHWWAPEHHWRTPVGQLKAKGHTDFTVHSGFSKISTFFVGYPIWNIQMGNTNMFVRQVIGYIISLVIVECLFVPWLYKLKLTNIH